MHILRIADSQGVVVVSIHSSQLQDQHPERKKRVLAADSDRDGASLTMMAMMI